MSPRYGVGIPWTRRALRSFGPGWPLWAIQPLETLRSGITWGSLRTRSTWRSLRTLRSQRASGALEALRARLTLDPLGS